MQSNDNLPTVVVSSFLFGPRQVKLNPATPFSTQESDTTRKVQLILKNFLQYN